MKKLLISLSIVFFALAAFAQGNYMTRAIEEGFRDVRQTPFAALSFADSAKTQALDSASWSVVSEFVVGAYKDVTGSDDTVTIQKAGGYLILASLSYLAGANDTINVQVFKNAAGIGPKTFTAEGATATNKNVSLGAYASCNEGDKITLRMVNLSDGTDATIRSGSLFVRRVYRAHY